MAVVSEGGVENENITEVLNDGRISKLRSALNKTVKACVTGLNYNLLKVHINPRNREDKRNLSNIHLQFQEKVLMFVKAEVDLMIREENVEQTLLKLDELCKLSLSQIGEVVWRPKGVPVDDVAAQLMPGILALRQKLKVLLDDTEAETDRMMRAVLERQRLIQSLKTELAENAKLLCQSAEKLM